LPPRSQKNQHLCENYSEVTDFYRAVRYMLLSTALFGMMNTLIKNLIDYPTFELIFFRSVTSLIIAYGYLKRFNIPIWGDQKTLLISRGLVGSTSMVLFFLSVNYISLGSAVTLRYVSPLFAAFLAIFLLNEKIRPIQWLFFTITFAGVALIKGFDSTVSVLGFSIAILSAFFSAGVYIILNKIGHGDHSVVVVFYFMLIATVVGAVGIGFTGWISPVLADYPSLFMLGVFGFFGQLYMTKAFRSYEANMIAPFKYVEVFFTLSIGVLVFEETYTFFSLLGIFLIISGLVCNILYKSRSQKKGS